MKRPRLTTYMRPYRKTIALGMVCAVVTIVLQTITPFIVRYAVNDLEAKTLTGIGLARYIGAFLLLSGIAVVSSFWMRRLPLGMARRVTYDIRTELYRHFSTMDPAFFRTHRTGDLMTRMSSDMNMIDMFLGGSLVIMTRAALMCVFVFGVMFYMNALLTVMIIVILLCMMGTLYFAMRLIRKRHHDVQEAVSNISSFAQETFSGMRLVKGFNLEERMEALFGLKNRDVARHNMRLNAVIQPLFPSFLFWFYLGFIVILIIGGRQVIQGSMSLGELVQFNQYLMIIQFPFLSLAWISSQIQRGLTSWERLAHLLEMEPSIRDDEQTRPELTQADGDLRLRDVCFTAGGRTLLDRIHLDIPKGSTLAITGPTGSGKTLLISLIARQALPTSGRITCGEHDLREFPLHVWRQYLALAMQEPVLFSQSIRHNITFGADEADDDAHMVWAADVAHLHADVEEFPDRYATRVGERGVTLSGGQRQRTSLSRAVARKPGLLILDDVLSAVDTETEAAITRKLYPVLEGRTSIVVSHRISVLQRADQIVVIENGRITQRGTHERLIEEPGYYRRLYHLQQVRND